MRTSFKLVKEYAELFSLPRSIKPVVPEKIDRERTVNEFNSIFSIFLNENRKTDVSLSIVGKTLAQMIYKLYEIGIAYGLPMDLLVQEIHNSNLTKLGNDGKPIRRNDGKILNGPKFKEPDIDKILETL